MPLVLELPMTLWSGLDGQMWDKCLKSGDNLPPIKGGTHTECEQEREREKRRKRKEKRGEREREREKKRKEKGG
jgi:hypothetical protein